MWSSDNHLKLRILKCETFILIPTLNKMLIQQRLSVRYLQQISSFIKINLVRTVAILKIWGHIMISYHMSYFYSKVKITRFEEAS